MNTQLLIENLTNPALLFFLLGIVAVQVKSDLEIPANSSKFISLYLLFSIGFRGGQELAHSGIDGNMIITIFVGLCSSIVIPIVAFFLLRKKLGIYNAGAIAAAYGSVSAVTFVTTVSFIESQGMSFGGHMIAMMALMEAPSIIMGVLLVSFFCKESKSNTSFSGILKHAFTGGSVLMILGSLIIGLLVSDKQAMGIAPFTNDIFKGFLTVFLLDMGITCGKQINGLWKKGWTPFLFSIAVPLINGMIMSVLSGYFLDSPGDRLLLTILTASASYIAVPAAMRLSLPKANPGIYVPMALAVTFPVNITLGIPIFHFIIQQYS